MRPGQIPRGVACLAALACVAWAGACRKESAPAPSVLRESGAPSVALLPSADAPAPSDARAPAAVPSWASAVPRPVYGDPPSLTIQAMYAAWHAHDEARAVDCFLRRDRDIGRKWYEPRLACRDLVILKTRRTEAGAEVDITCDGEALPYALEGEDGVWKIDARRTQALVAPLARASIDAFLRDAGYGDAGVSRAFEIIDEVRGVAPRR